MTEKKSETVTSVHVEKHSGSEAHATINKDGRKSSASGDTADEALSKAARGSKEKSKD